LKHVAANWQQQQQDWPLSFDTGCWGSIALLRTGGTWINLTYGSLWASNGLNNVCAVHTPQQVRCCHQCSHVLYYWRRASVRNVHHSTGFGKMMIRLGQPFSDGRLAFTDMMLQQQQT